MLRFAFAMLVTLIAVAACAALRVDAADRRSLSGDVRDAATRAPIAHALVRVDDGAGRILARTLTSGNGSFAVTFASSATLIVRTSARGFVSSQQTYERDSLPITIGIALQPDAALRQIGATSVARDDRASGARETLVPSALTAQNALRVADGLATLPGLTFSGDALAPGGDAYVSVRGLRPGEGQALLDGHPIGPIGASVSAPDTDGIVAGFNFQDAPYFALRSIDAELGANAKPAFGIDAIGGTIDLRTLEPTTAFHGDLAQGAGSEGRSFTTLRATGTSGNVGYALADAVSGTYGLFAGGPIAQTGLRGTDLTTPTLHDVTYDVSGDYVLRDDLAKVVVAMAPGISLALTAYDATAWSDKTGEGDNDDNPYAYVLANAPVGASPSCPHGVVVSENAGAKCLSPADYAAAASGPAGGGPGAWQALRDQDYDARITANAGAVMLEAQTFVDDYVLLYHRPQSLVNGPLDEFLDRWTTSGVSASASAPLGARDTARANIAWLAQSFDGDATAPGSSGFVSLAPDARIVRSLSLEDTFAATARLSIAGRALVDDPSDESARIDTNLAVTYRPTARDTLRAQAARSGEDPSLTTDRIDFVPIGALNPDCGAIARASATEPADVDIGTGPASALQAERASDVEFDYERMFRSGSLGVSAYASGLTNEIVSAATSAGALPSGVANALGSRIASFCGSAPPPGTVAFTLSRPFNAATGRLRGIELTGRSAIATHVSLDYAYDLQSSVSNDLPAAVLRTNPTLVNGAQTFDVPLHKATLGIEVASRAGTFALEGHAVGTNNSQQLPAYAYADASFERSLAKQFKLGIGVSNVFDSHAQTYGLVGLGVPYATNAYNAALAAPFVQPYNERYGLAPASLTATITAHL